RGTKRTKGKKTWEPRRARRSRSSKTNFTSCPSRPSRFPPSRRSRAGLLLGGGLLGRRGVGVGAPDGAAAAVGWTEAPHVDAEVADLVVENALRGVEQPRGLGAVAARRLERVLDEVALEPLDGVPQRHARDGVGGVGRLQRRRQVMA